jgi:hypothetical protein
MHMRNEPSGFGRNSTGAPYPEWEGCIQPFASMSFTRSSTSCRSFKDRRKAGRFGGLKPSCKGTASAVMPRCCCVQAGGSNKSWNSSRRAVRCVSSLGASMFGSRASRTCTRKAGVQPFRGRRNSRAAHTAEMMVGAGVDWSDSRRGCKVMGLFQVLQ